MKCEKCSQALAAAICSSRGSAKPMVARDQVTLLSAWHCGGARPASAFASAARTAVATPGRVGCFRIASWASGVLAITFARRCSAVERFTRFIWGRYASIVDMKSSRSPVSATAMIWLLMSGNVRRLAAWRARALGRALAPRAAPDIATCADGDM